MGTSEEPFAVGHVVTSRIHVGLPSHETEQGSLVGSAPQVAECIRRELPPGVNQVQVRFDAPCASAYAEQVERFGVEVGPLLQP
jgi:hypothetical protein